MWNFIHVMSRINTSTVVVYNVQTHVDSCLTRSHVSHRCYFFFFFFFFFVWSLFAFTAVLVRAAPATRHPKQQSEICDRFVLPNAAWICGGRPGNVTDNFAQKHIHVWHVKRMSQNQDGDNCCHYKPESKLQHKRKDRTCSPPLNWRLAKKSGP